MYRNLIVDYVDDFMSLYPDRPISRNHGGMGINHCFGLYAMLRILRPSTIVESGVWRGQSTWLIEAAAPQANLFCLDPYPNHRMWTSRRANYIESDFGSVDWSEIDVTNSLCFFDDHQSAYARLMEMQWWGFSRAIFEDNFPVGEGDAYSLRHAFAEFGHPRIQMSSDYAPRGMRARLVRHVEERVLERRYYRQHVLRHPNGVDRKALEKNLNVYWEVPALVLNPTSNWGKAWDGPYAPASSPLFPDLSKAPALADLLGSMTEIEVRHELAYCYLAFVELKR